MTNFNESKLSKVLARRIIAPEDRSQLLPFSTPIYCPDYKGVRANRVTIINPNTNSFLKSTTATDTTGIGTSVAKSTATLNSLVTNQGGVTIDDTGTATGFATSKYLAIESATAVGIAKLHISGFIPSSVTTAVNIISFTSGGVVTVLAVQPNGNITLTEGTASATLGTAKLDVEFHMDVSIVTGDSGIRVDITAKQLLEDNSIFSTSIDLTGTSITLITFGASADARYKMDLSHAYFVLTSSNKRVHFYNSSKTATDPSTISNTVDIDLNIPVSRTYFVPHQVDLEADVNLIDMIKSDFGAVFKNAVSTAIMNYIVANKADIKAITMEDSDTLATALGHVIAENIMNGTGQRYSIYKYSNGAPVTTMIDSAGPNYDDLALDDENPDAPLTLSEFRRMYASKDDVGQPADFYFERPTLLIDFPKFQEYQAGLCAGTIKQYVEKRMNVDTAKIDFTDIGEGVFGSNDCFAVAFTDADISIEHDKEFFADNVCVTIYFGIKLINDANLRILS